ncbi:MAG: UDP-N-acetylglucosamine--N-acetylmuramyl-(pentapeptide) pyrophosphoryl-undecaprenol N-acetylglucosamine transferase [Clostridia bacterium]|nr:UDP-N-acetylglucosamine--N-acetylmuramyl-(pentapeptide) pyrophosphoryl-undecaprenol N-acetylglucosamine transferase [Clostridia bacterium]
MKIVFCGGGTAGHVTPNFALMEKLIGNDMYYMGTGSMEKRLTEQYVENGTLVEFREITAGKLKRKFALSNLLLPFTLAKSISQCKKHLKQIAPDVVFSKGGFVGLPVVIAANKLKIPTIVHESDMSLGLANKISSLYATKLFTTFDCSKKGQTVGAIVRQSALEGDRNKGLAAMDFDGKKPILLVLGGSLGSVALNNALLKCKTLANTFDIFVLTGKGKRVDCDFIHQSEYCLDMPSLFSATTLAVCRGDANSLCELTETKTPFVCVPLEKSSLGEQFDNANLFCNQKHCGVLLREKDLSQNTLSNAVLSVYKNLESYKKNQKNFCINGTSTVLTLIENEILNFKKTSL